MSRKKGSKNKIKDLKKTDGELVQVAENSSDQQKPKYKNLAEIMGEETVVDIADFEKFRIMLNSMNTADIETLCPKYGLIPVDSRSRMIERLEREWKKRNRKNFDFQPEEVRINKDLAKEVKDILSLSR